MSDEVEKGESPVENGLWMGLVQATLARSSDETRPNPNRPPEVSAMASQYLRRSSVVISKRPPDANSALTRRRARRNTLSSGRRSSHSMS